jgi:AraC-like DNA-binding protein
VRLTYVHDDLAAAEPEVATVADIARTWGFLDLDGFRTLYCRTYGSTPESRLDH